MRSLLLAVALLSPIEQLDWAVAERVQQVAQEQRAHHSAWYPVMRAATSWGRPVVVVSGLVVIVAADLLSGYGWGTARLAVAALAGTNLLVEVGKRVVNRPRPDGEHKRSNSSFPSSPAANAFALAWVLSARWKRGWPLFAALALLVAASRVYLNRHFVSDVVAGALLGVVVACVAQHWLPLPRGSKAKAPREGTITV